MAAAIHSGTKSGPVDCRWTQTWTWLGWDWDSGTSDPRRPVARGSLCKGLTVGRGATSDFLGRGWVWKEGRKGVNGYFHSVASRACGEVAKGLVLPSRLRNVRHAYASRYMLICRPTASKSKYQDSTSSRVSSVKADARHTYQVPTYTKRPIPQQSKTGPARRAAMAQALILGSC